MANISFTALFTVPGWHELVQKHLLGHERSAWGLAAATGSLLGFALLYNLHSWCQVRCQAVQPVRQLQLACLTQQDNERPLPPILMLHVQCCVARRS